MTATATELTNHIRDRTSHHAENSDRTTQPRRTGCEETRASQRTSHHAENSGREDAATSERL